MEAAMEQTQLSEELIKRYLLGELPESEQAALEDDYFADKAKYNQICQMEDKLMDDYARGYLSQAERQRFERHFLATPRRQAHLNFAQALTQLLDQPAVATPALSPVAAQDAKAAPLLRRLSATVSGWQSFLALLRSPRPTLGLAFVAAALVIVLGGLWFLNRNARVREQQVVTQRPPDATQQRAPTPDQQIIAQSVPSPRSQPSTVFFALSLGAFRGSGSDQPPPLVIPRGAELVRLQLKLTENVFPRYQVRLQTTEGKEVLNQQGLKARRTKSGDDLMLNIPAGKFSSGEYILALSGVSATGEVESLGKSILKVEKR
jgi:anti-sigma factor RsiW